jgi:hypothetical protein
MTSDKYAKLDVNSVHVREISKDDTITMTAGAGKAGMTS